MAKRQAVFYFTLGNNMMKNDSGALFYLNTANVWQFSGRLLGYFNGDLDDDDVKQLPNLAAAKKWYAKVTGGKPWVA